MSLLPDWTPTQGSLTIDMVAAVRVLVPESSRIIATHLEWIAAELLGR
ncbi:MAG: hypothetical protein ACLU48_04480 [Clostridiaceae bacterium]